MSMFQKSIINKYLAGLNKEKVERAYHIFKENYTSVKIELIKKLKEEEYQDGFLRGLFVDALGYIIKPDDNYNLVREFKNQSDAKKADGAILKDGKAIGVVELKSTQTKNLNSVTAQAFSYKNNQPDCRYVITSNFRKLRFYIDYATEYEEFDLFQLSKKEFDLLYLFLSKECLFQDIPIRIKEESIIHEENISKQLYQDYSNFKYRLFNNLVKNNPDQEKLTLFKNSQKLIDRFLFILFAEDRGLLPPNSIGRIIQRFQTLKEEDAYKPLYEIYKQYFGYMNIGRKGKRSCDDISAYNGGLFYPDEMLDGILIDDDFLIEDLQRLSVYDFNSEIDVNILGHIFEHSLSEIEEITAEIEGVSFDKAKGKRKKDGVFYTPSYITKYIVESTIGRLCIKKQKEFGFHEIIIDKSYHIKSGKLSKKGKLLYKKLEDYKDWLMSLKIVDPACGSGAFLNQALNYLIKEHNFIIEFQAELDKGQISLFNIETAVLENNLYGVDINEESVEIAKLSLWLRTAKKGRKLSVLSKNIKCGNSLVADPEIVGNKAFNWQEEFPDVFDKGGFDVVIGNPPYLRVQGLRENFETESIFYETFFKSATGRFDIYVLFMEQSLKLINKGGVISFILPHKFLVGEYGKGIRGLFKQNKSVNSILHFGSELVFKDASTYTCIINLSHANSVIKYKQIKPSEILGSFEFNQIEYDSLSEKKWELSNKDISSVFSKLSKQPLKVKDVFSFIRTGVDSGVDDLFILQGKIKADKFLGYSKILGCNVEIESKMVKPLLKGKDAKRYSPVSFDHFIIYPHYEIGNKTVPYSEEVMKEQFPLTYSYFLPFKDELIKKKIHKKTNPQYWYSLHRSRDIKLFEQEKIITPETSLGGNLTFDTNHYYHNTQVYSLVKNENFDGDYLFWLAIMNSSLFWFYLKQTGAVLRGGYFRFKTKFLEPFPLPKPPTKKEQACFIDLVVQISANTREFFEIKEKFLKYFKSQFTIEKPNTKLNNWFDLEFNFFIAELNKAIQKAGGEKLKKIAEMEWMDIFEVKKTEAQNLKLKINTLDKTIDKMVYELYGLNEVDINIIEID